MDQKKGRTMNDRSPVAHGGIFVNFFLGIGLMLGGLFLGKSAERAVHYLRHDNSYVKVKGLVERNVLSDEASMKVSFSVMGNDIKELIKCSDEHLDDIRQFLAANRIQTTECTCYGPEIDDRHKNFRATSYELAPPQDRYCLKWNVRIRSSDTSKVSDLQATLGVFSMQQSQKSLPVIPIYHVSPPSYEFTNLESVRAELIAAATKSARKAADQFAEDSRCKVGKIKVADQGTIVINGDGPVKLLRLISNVSFFLE
jgi:hypothetical protein